MFELKRSEENPILVPLEEHQWESDSVFNGCPVSGDSHYHFLYRAVSAPTSVSGIALQLSSIGCASSTDGIHFNNRRQFIKPEMEWDKFGCEDPRITKIDGKYYIFYTAISTYPFKPEGIKVGVAITDDFKKIQTRKLVTPFNAKAMALFPEKIDGKLTAVLTVNTDRPPSKIAIAKFENEKQIWSNAYWEGWYQFLDDYVLPLKRSDKDHVEVGAPPIKTEEGWLLIFSYIQNYFSPPAVFGIEAVLLDLENPNKIIARTEKPLLLPQAVYEIYGKVPQIIFPSGAMVVDDSLWLYYGAADTTCAVATGNLRDLLDDMLFSKIKNLRLTRYSGNPILKPKPENSWEDKSVLNPAAIYEDGKVHLVYRAIDHNDLSTLGYAASRNGFTIDERLNMPVYKPRMDFESKGCEDPRITKIDNTLYMCYTAFDGHIPRVAVTSIDVKDFLNKNWNWSEPALLSPPGFDDKDAAVFPRKFEGKYAVLHRIGKSIWLDMVEGFDSGKWIKGNVIMSSRDEPVPVEKIGISGPPIETKQGWLLLYHIVSKRNGRVFYYVSAALLELNQPWKVIARRKNPLIEPEKPYEIEGLVGNVVFPCGNILINNQLFVYYGGGDSVIGVATVDINELIDGILVENNLLSHAATLKKKWAKARYSAIACKKFEGIVPGVSLTLPTKIKSSTGEYIMTRHFYNKIRNKGQKEFEHFVYKELAVPSEANVAKIVESIRAFIKQVETETSERLYPGDLFTVEGTRQAVQAIFNGFNQHHSYSLKADTAAKILKLFQPTNLLIKFAINNISELEDKYSPNDLLAISSLSEGRDYTDRVWDWIWNNASPANFTTQPLEFMVFDCDLFPSLADMKEASALSKLAGRVMLSNLRKNSGGDYPKLRYFTIVAKNIIEASSYEKIWKTYARQKADFGTKIIKSMEGHWGRETLSAHNIFENMHQVVLVQHLKQLAEQLSAQGDTALADLISKAAASYHLCHIFPNGQFVPCSIWTWASYSFKGGKGLPIPQSVRVERDWFSRELLESIYNSAGGNKDKLYKKIVELMAEGSESENIAKVLFKEMRFSSPTD